MKIKTKIALGIGIFSISLSLSLANFSENRIEDLLITKSYASENAYNITKNSKNSDNVLGFFQWVKAVKPNESDQIDRAIRIINQYPTYTYYNNREDATSLKNIKISLGILQRLNSLRINDKNFPGLRSLGTSHRMLAIGISNANNSLTYDIGHLRHFKVGENLSWGQDKSPIDRWYTDEIKIYNRNPKANFDSIAHYLNIVSKYYNISSLAINNKQINGTYTVYSQVLDNAENNETVYSIGEYINLINQYEAYLQTGTIKTSYQNTQNNYKSSEEKTYTKKVNKNSNSLTDKIKLKIKSLKKKINAMEYIRYRMPESTIRYQKQIDQAIIQAKRALSKAESYLKSYDN